MRGVDHRERQQAILKGGRVADNLYWIGRHAERAETVMHGASKLRR